MIERILKITWFPIVLGIWFALWAKFSAGVIESNPSLGVVVAICVVVGALWVVTVTILRIMQPQYRMSPTEQVMFDTACYPLLVFGLLCLAELIYSLIF